MDHPINGHHLMRFTNKFVNRFVLTLLIIEFGNQFISCTVNKQAETRSQALNISNDHLISRLRSNDSSDYLKNHPADNIVGVARNNNHTLSHNSSDYRTTDQMHSRLFNLTFHNISSHVSTDSSSNSLDIKQKNQNNEFVGLHNSTKSNVLNATNVNQKNESGKFVNQAQSDLEIKSKSAIIKKEHMSFTNRINKLIGLNKSSLMNQTMITNHRNISKVTSEQIKLLNLKSSLNESSSIISTSSVTTVANVLNGSTSSSSPSPINNIYVVEKMLTSTSPTMIHNKETQFISSPKEQISKEQQSEKVLVYPVQTDQSNDQSLSGQSKRAPHYLEEKYRLQALSTSTIAPTKNERLLDKPTPILDTKPLIEDIDGDLNLRKLDERLINEGELIHHGSSSVEESSYELGSSYHNAHHSNYRHSSKNELQNKTQILDSFLWFEKNCIKNCNCHSNKKWEAVNSQSRKTLNCSNKEFIDYPDIPFELGKHVERLLLSGNNIRKLQVDIDSFHCEKLIELDLSNNQIEQLSVNSLNYKHIQHPIVEFHPSHKYHPEEDSLQRKITNSSKNFPTNNSSMINKVNENTTLPSTLNLTAVNNKTRQHLFSHCHRLKMLLLSGNDLNTLSTGGFRGLKRLRKLYLDNTQIKFIEKNAFLGANELRLLSLRFNLLTAIHSDMFQHMINLRVLDLTGNSLTYLGVGVFNSLVALQALHLGHNKIRQLSFQCFSGLDGLQLLTLNSNQLKNVPRFALQPLKKLKILNMSGNPIKVLKEDDFSHSFLQLLLLNHLTQLQYVSRFAFWDLPYLNELQITHCNEFVHLDEQAIVGAPALHRLRLDHNAISQLDDRLLENLARMTIARRRLKVYLGKNPFRCNCFLRSVYLCARDQHQCKIELPDRNNITCTFRKTPNDTTVIEQKNPTKNADQIYRISELNDVQLSNECAPSFVSVITPINVTIVKRLRSKLTLSCKTQGVPTPNVYWLQPSGEVHKEKLITRHGHDLVESDLLTSPHAFQNDDNAEQSIIEQTENQLLANQATAAFIPYSNGVLMSSNSLSLTLPSTAHHSSSTLRINHLTVNDAGLYTCIADNRLGLIRSHVRLITQQLKIDLEAENVSTNYITIRWQVNSIFNPPLSEMLNDNSSTETYGSNEQNLDSADNTSSTIPPTTKHSVLLDKFNIDFDEAILHSKNEQNLNLLDYQLLYKSESYDTDEDSKQTNAETLGSERIFESNKFFASYESVQINRQLKSFTVAGLRPGTRYKICVAVRELREPRIDEVDYPNHSSGLFKKRSIKRSFKRLKRNLISVESASYLAIGCMHSETVHAAFYARNIILKAEKFPVLLSTAFGTAIKMTLVCTVLAILIVLFMSAYNWTKQHQRRSAYETPRKTLLSLAACKRQQSSTEINTPYSTPLHQLSVSNQQMNQILQMENVHSPLMLTRRT